MELYRYDDTVVRYVLPDYQVGIANESKSQHFNTRRRTDHAFVAVK